MKTKRIIALAAATMVGMTLAAQTLNVQVGNVTYQIPSAQAGEMVYQSGETVTILDKVYNLSEVDRMYVDNTDVVDNTVQVAYDGDEAQVFVAGNVARYITVAMSGAHVSIIQSSDVAEEITYTLSGQTGDGEFYMTGSYKATVELNGLTLTNANPV